MRPSAHIFAFALLLLRMATGDAASIAGPQPKMIAEEITSTSKPNLFEPGEEMAGTTISSRNAVYLGDCSPSEPFAFPLGSRSGRGVVGSHCDVADSIVVSDKGRNATVKGSPEPSFFALGRPESDKFCGVAFSFGDGSDPKVRATAEVACPAGDTPVVVILREDDSGSDGETSIEATVSCGDGGGLGQRLGLSREAALRSRAVLRGQTRGRGGAGRPPVEFSDASESEITIKRKDGAPESDAGVALVHVVLDDGSGGEVLRTFIIKSKGCGSTGMKRRLRSVGLRSSSVNDDGDIELDFDLDDLPDLHPPGKDEEVPRFKVKARIGIVSSSAKQDKGLAPENSTAFAEGIHRIVDVSAYLTHERSTMVVHGGWVRRALSSNSEQWGAEWDVVVEEAVALDPEEGYRTVARLAGVHPTGVGRLIADTPTTEEELGISDEMRQGRRPARLNRSLRGLQTYPFRKIVVHGYCSGNQFRMSDFTNAVAFVDPDSGTNNWSNDAFAVKILNFAADNGIEGCGIIAHSQGGLASLHLKDSYWSCLDYSQGGRPIQAVGSPFRGSVLAESLYLLDSVFGAGCGENADLTESGAESWLAEISSSARGAVDYYTTSHRDSGSWWVWDYCHMATDMFLSNPEDGAVEKARGQLPGGVNRGHKTNWCHSIGMRDPRQTLDMNRNLQMDAFANPTMSPTSGPTTSRPTSNPTMNPTSNPTMSPTTSNPTMNPTSNPTSNPTVNPTLNPTTSNPTVNPTSNPTMSPTTSNPTMNPTSNPTSNPTMNPTLNPTTSNPTMNPTSNPTSNPTMNPTSNPTSNPTINPTMNPTTSSPTMNPTSNPTTWKSKSKSKSGKSKSGKSESGKSESGKSKSGKSKSGKSKSSKAHTANEHVISMPFRYASMSFDLYDMVMPVADGHSFEQDMI